MMASQPCRSGESCHRKVTGCLATSEIAQYASWSQLEQGNMITPNFIAESSPWQGKLEFSMGFEPVRRGGHPTSNAIFPAHQHHRRGAARLVRRTVLRLACRGRAVVVRAGLPACAVGAVLGD